MNGAIGAHSSAMTERALRFVRTLALLGGATGAGCGARTDLDPVVVTDESDSSTTDTALPPGKCLRGRTPEITACPAGHTCDLAASGTLRCVDDTVDVGPRSSCGTITCADWCSCLSAAESSCSCIMPVEGPLPPPDLVA